MLEFFFEFFQTKNFDLHAEPSTRQLEKSHERAATVNTSHEADPDGVEGTKVNMKKMLIFSHALRLVLQPGRFRTTVIARGAPFKVATDLHTCNPPSHIGIQCQCDALEYSD
jgi:hypothetical protein